VHGIKGCRTTREQHCVDTHIVVTHRFGAKDNAAVHVPCKYVAQYSLKYNV